MILQTSCDSPCWRHPAILIVRSSQEYETESIRDGGPASQYLCWLGTQPVDFARERFPSIVLDICKPCSRIDDGVDTPLLVHLSARSPALFFVWRNEVQIDMQPQSRHPNGFATTATNILFITNASTEAKACQG